MSVVLCHALAISALYPEFSHTYSRKQVGCLQAHKLTLQLCPPRVLCRLQVSLRGRRADTDSTFVSGFQASGPSTSFAAFAPNALKCASAEQLADENPFTQDGFESFLLTMQERICREVNNLNFGKDFFCQVLLSGGTP